MCTGRSSNVDETVDGALHAHLGDLVLELLGPGVDQHLLKELCVPSTNLADIE